MSQQRASMAVVGRLPRKGASKSSEKPQFSCKDSAFSSVKVEQVTNVGDTKTNGFSDVDDEDGLFDLNREPIEALWEKEELKEDFVGDDRSQKLDYDDYDDEFDPEEEIGVEYDERVIEHDNVEQENEGEVEWGETDVVEDEDGDMVDVEMTSIVQEGMSSNAVEGEEDAGHAQEHDIANDEDQHEHCEVMKEHHKQKEFEVFVGGLDRGASEEDLKEVFSTIGEVIEVRLKMNPHTKKNLGFAFIRFATIEQAKQAVSELKYAVVNGKECSVIPSRENDTLFLGNICNAWTKEVLKVKLKKYGVENFENLTLLMDANNEGMNRGFAFLEFFSHADAKYAYKQLAKRDVVFGIDRTAKVQFADLYKSPRDKSMARVNTVFVDGIPASWDEGCVKGHLKQFGRIEKIVLACNLPRAKRKNFGFVTFCTHADAVACAEGINNAELGGEEKVKVRAELARPLHRGKLNHGIQKIHSFGRDGEWCGRGSPAHTTLHRSAKVLRCSSRAGASGERLGTFALKRPRGDSVELLTAFELKRSRGARDRQLDMAAPGRTRHFSPLARSYDQKQPEVPHAKTSSKRDLTRRDEALVKGKAAVEYGSRSFAGRRSTYIDADYHSPEPCCTHIAPCYASRTATARQVYIDGDYSQRVQRLPSSYREAHSEDYDLISGSKLPYSSMDDSTSRFNNVNYDSGSTASQYEDVYFERSVKSDVGYGGRRSFAEDSHGFHGSRRYMDYRGSERGGHLSNRMYYSDYDSEYLSRGVDNGVSSYISQYSGRGMRSSRYLGSKEFQLHY